jgi:S1-C subfamily serine protease
MATTEATPRSRETRLLLVTIAVSVGVLLLLARFRFPDEAATQTVPSAPAPLERLAARATYDELASIMADLERRIVPRVAIVSTRDAEGNETLVVAPRLLPDRAVALVDGSASVAATPGAADLELIGRDEAHSVAVVRVPALDDGAVPLRQGQPRTGPRYVAAVEASPTGATVRPVYVARVEALDEPDGRQTLLLSGLQQSVSRGSAIFTLDGAFLGLVSQAGDSAVLLSGDTLRAAMDAARPDDQQARASLGVDVDALTPALTRATGAGEGVVVVRVHPAGPAAGILQSGDVIASIGGTAVNSIESFRRTERSVKPGSEITVTGTRRRSPMNVEVQAVDSVAPTTSDGTGLVGRMVPGAGIEVVSVADGGAADAAGVARGDLIVAIDGEPARDLATLARRFRSAAAGDAVLVTVQRNQRHRVLALEKR